jgi:hypothetical protein
MRTTASCSPQGPKRRTTIRFSKAWQSKRMTDENKKRPERQYSRRRTGSFSRPDLAIPCRVAPQQSPAPFHQANRLYLKTAAGAPTPPKIGQTRPPAPAAVHDIKNSPSPAGAKPSNTHKPPRKTTRKSTRVHLSILTRPSVAAFNAPIDTWSGLADQGRAEKQLAPIPGRGRGAGCRRLRRRPGNPHCPGQIRNGSDGQGYI